MQNSTTQTTARQQNPSDLGFQSTQILDINLNCANRRILVCRVLKKRKGYKGPEDEDRTENVILECEQSQAHVREDEVFSQEVKRLKQLRRKQNTHHKSRP